MLTILIILAVWLLPANGASDTNYRLSTPISPERYSIWITPYFDTADENAFTFDGRVTIAIKTNTVVKQIQLHSEDLIINATTGVTVTQGSTVINLNETNPLVFDTKYTFVYINLATELNPNVEYTVDITYRGQIRNDLNGFYRNYYMDGGVKKWLGATQMEPTHARKVFPCFDEPAYKAKFTLIITRPATFAPTLANTKLNSVVQQNDRVQETFFETPLMSTYLVAFMVSEFEAVQHSINGTKELGIYAQPSAKNYSEYAFEFSKDVVNALSEYFDFDYYSVDTNLKLDHVALPDFRAGAMENWGLINYREAYLMYTPQESTPTYRYRVSQIIAHETTHMWFGNLVTCHWWSNIWLNEGFANYFQDYITAKIRPDVGSNDMLVISSVYDAYAADEAISVAAITNEAVNSPAEISGHFGLISYQKAGSIIRMMHHAMGDVAFQQGLRTYLRVNQLNVGDPDKLYTALNQGLQTTNTTTSIADLTNMMKSWIVQSGHPVLQVNVDYDQQVISFSQKRFYIDSKNSTNEIYHIPITVATKSQPNFGDTKPQLIMNTKELNLNLTNATHEWIIVNIQETGFYRVNYDEHSWLMISNALKEERNVIHYLNRAKIVNDLFAFVYADLVNFDLLYEVLGFLKEEDEFAVLNAAIRGLNKLRNSYLGTSALEHIESYSLEILGPVIEKLGFEVKNDSYVTQRNRMQVLEFACKLGHEGCVNFAVTTFKQFKENDTYVHPSLRPTVYCNGLRHGDSSDYEFLWERMSTTTVANEARTIGEALGCTNNKESLRKYLTSISGDNSTIRVQDLTMPLSSALLTYDNLDLVLDVVLENYVAWTKEFSSMESILATVASALHREAEFTKFETWLANCTTECSETSTSAAVTALSQARLSATWAADHMEEILKSLRNSASMSVPSTLLVSITLFFLFFK